MNSTVIKTLFSTLSLGHSGERLTTLLFHKVPQVVDALTPNELCFAEFERMMDFLQENMRVLPLSEAVDALARGKLPARAVALTFDDGYSDWITSVAPALRQRNFPATFFVTTEQMSGPALWHERIISGVRSLPNKGGVLPFGFGSYDDLSDSTDRIRLVKDLQERLKYAPLAERLTEIEMLEAQACSPLVPPPAFDINSVRELHSQGFEIGAHTISHPILSECSFDEAMREIGGSREELEGIVGGAVTGFAYPNGRPSRDFSTDHVKMVKSCGYKLAVVTSGGVATRNSDCFQLPRFTPWDADRAHLAYQLARNQLVRERSINPDAVKPADEGMRCLLVASTFPPIHGGSAVVYDSLCRHMPEGSIHVLTAKKNYLSHQVVEGWEKHDKAAPYPVERIALLRQFMMPPPANSLISLCRLVFSDIPLYFRVFWAAANIVRKHRINVVCIGELVTGSWLGIMLRRFFGCKLIIYIHGEEVTTATGGRLHGARRKHYLQAADKVVAVSSFTCDALTDQMGLSNESMTLIHNGVDVSQFSPGEPDPALIARHGLTGKKVILTVGRLVPRKGTDMAIRAMAKVIKQMPDIHYLIIGEGEYKPTLVEIIASEKMEKNVTLVGKVAEGELLAYLRTCDVFLMPNRTMPDGDTEGFGLVFREANACGKPVIGGRAGGAVEAVVDESTGLIVDGTNPEEIAAAILRLLSDEESAARMGANGLALAQQNTTVTMALRFFKVCQRVIRESQQ